MKVIAINIQVPRWIDDFFRTEAKSRLTSKSAIMREVLVEYVRRKQAKRESSESEVTAAA